MQNLSQYLQTVANGRRRELIPFVYHHTSGRVQTGPFQGQVIVPQYMWGDSDITGKLMGVYEDELHEFIEDAVSREPDAVINIGSAEGYYSIGLAQRLKSTTVMAVDIEPRAAEIVKLNAEANGVDNVLAITQTVDVQWLQTTLANLQRPFIVSDCEGGEDVLLDPTTVPALAKAMILVESHDCLIDGITQTLCQRFSSTHDLQTVAQQTKDAYSPSWCESLSDCDKWCLVHEGRPSTGRWIYMVPKQ